MQHVEDSGERQAKEPTLRAPVVSIALCTHNGERHLTAQVESLLAQDYPD
jgi:hypothetical protein